MPLTDTRIRNARPQDKPYRLSDGGGLHLEVRPTGAKLWRYRYRVGGTENTFAIGEYGNRPGQFTLAEAREERAKARHLVKQGIHPAHQRKTERIRRATEAADTFEAVAREWLEHKADNWTPRTHRQRQRLLERDVFPRFGSLPVRQVTAAHVLDVVTRIEKRAPAFAAMARQAIGAIFAYAVATLRADTDPSWPVRSALKPRVTKHKTPLALKEIPAFLEALEAFPGYPSNKMALQLVLLTLVRTNEALGATWSEFDLDSAEWRIPAERMKKRSAHRIPLSRQAVDLLRRLQGVTGGRTYLFPNRGDPRKPASIGVLWKMVASMGYEGRFSPHGIRTTGSTILNEMRYRPEVIECQLAHKDRNKTRASYNRAEYFEERRQMMQAWADLIDAKVAEKGKAQRVSPIRSATN